MSSASASSPAVGDCQFANLTMLEKPRPLTALASFPGSGNTWVRHLLQQATGIGTGSIYCDGRLRNNGFPFECNPQRDRLLVTKAHKGLGKDLEAKAAILIVRNPYNALLAYFNYAKCRDNPHLGIAPYSAFQTDWPMFAKIITKMWEDSTMFYMEEFKGRVLLVLYEALKVNLKQEVTRMLTFLNQTVQEDRMGCLLRNSTGQYRRANASGLIPEDIYPANLTEHINNAISRVAPTLKSRHGVDISIYKR